MITCVLAIDPGPTESAYVIYDGRCVRDHKKVDNTTLLARLDGFAAKDSEILVIEQIASFGMAVGAEVFETCVWTGRFIHAWAGIGLIAWDRIKRHEVKSELCNTQRAKDANIRQALIDRFGPGKEKAIGTKRSQGPLYGIAGDEWSALAVAVTWWEINQRKGRC